MYINYIKRLVFKFKITDNNFKMFCKTYFIVSVKVSQIIRQGASANQINNRDTKNQVLSSHVH